PKSASLTDEIWKIGAPSFRRDMAQSADIVEELIRIEGFDALPADSLPRPEGPAKLVTTPLQNRVRIARRVMASRGFLEVVTWSFMSKDKAALFVGGANALHSGLVVDNPIASDLDYMRPSILANLAEAAQRNADHGAGEVRLFEAGPVYRGDGPKEQASIVSALVRPKPARHWAGAPKPYDAFAAKADAFALLEALGQPADRFQIGEIDADYWHPGRSATLRMGPKNIIARFGELHPATLKALDVEGPIAAFELDLGALPTPKAKGGKTKPKLNKADLTPIVRDFAFETVDETPAGEIARLAGAADKALITGARVFDVYRGKGVEDGHKSVAIEVTLQPRGEALTDKDIDAVADKIVKAVAKGVGARLRA
ncbi:MAG: phenylalanine--tRNA ligase subunit beta, partial [Pseudomonadota bacterium]